MTAIIIILNIIILLILPFVFVGIIKKTKAFWAGRKGAPVIQPFYDFVRLLKKEQVISSTTGMIFKVAPVVIFSTILFAGLFAPMICGKSIISLSYAFVIFAYLLGLGKFFSLISAMDTGSSFEGMGASREACFTTFIEPAFFMIMASIIAFTGNYTFSGISEIIKQDNPFCILIIIFSIIALFIMLLVEGCRVPVDDPATHLELTMIHEVMILDNSGRDLALIIWSAGMKMVLLASLIINLVLPNNLTILQFLPLYLVLMAVLAIITGTLESAVARLRMMLVFEFVFMMSSIALVILSLVILKIFGS